MTNLSGEAMKKIPVYLLIFVIKIAVSEPLHFPPGINNKMELAEVKSGDTVIIKSGPVWVLDKNAHDLFAASIKKQNTIDTLIDEHLNSVDSALIMYHDLIRQYEKIDSIQNFVIDSVRILTFKTDSLLTRSRENTHKAIGQSFLVSGLLGGIAGFTIPRDQKLWVNSVSALSGAAIGILINYIILR